MEIKLETKEAVHLVYKDCPRCHRTFNTKKRKKTTHHIIPKFLEPKTETTITLCDECHKELNNHYTGLPDINKKGKKGEIKGIDFNTFRGNINHLRGKFKNKEIDRGEFGEGLWGNLVNYLSEQDFLIKEYLLKGAKK